MALEDLTDKELESLRENYEGLMFEPLSKVTVLILHKKIKEINALLRERGLVDAKNREDKHARVEGVGSA